MHLDYKTYWGSLVYKNNSKVLVYNAVEVEGVKYSQQLLPFHDSRGVSYQLHRNTTRLFHDFVERVFKINNSPILFDKYDKINVYRMVKLQKLKVYKEYYFH